MLIAGSLFRGYVTTADEGYHIDPVEQSLTGRHYIFRDSDYVGLNLTCGNRHDVSHLKTSSAPKVWMVCWCYLMAFVYSVNELLF